MTRIEELKAVIVLLNKKLHIDHEPKMHKFKKDYIETMIVKESEIFKSFQEDNEVHISFVRSMIEKEFARSTEESQGFYQKYTIKSFEQVKVKAKAFHHGRPGLELQGRLDKEFVESNALSHLKLTKPNMFEIVRSRAMNMRDEELKMIINSNFDVFSIVRSVRGILDSFWLQLQIAGDFKAVSSFCEFVYVWLGSYEVGATGRIKEAALSHKEADVERIRLILHLNSAFFQKHWECQVFSDFINSKCTVDEVYFYLSCRDTLNHGLALLNPKNCFEIVQRENTAAILELVKKILGRFEDRDSQTILAKLRDSSIIKSNGKEHLDVAFVLKILLELYRADKKMRYSYLKKDLDLEENLNDMLPKHTTSHVEQKPHEYLTSFENFRKFVDKHFPFLSETEKLQVFSDSYNVGSGEVTFDALFTSLHEHGTFIKDMRVRYLTFDVAEITASPQSMPTALQDTNVAFFRKLKENQSAEYLLRDSLNPVIESFGIEKLSFDLKSQEGWLDGSKFGLGWKDLFMVYTKTMNQRCLASALAMLSFRKPPDVHYLSKVMAENSRHFQDIARPVEDWKAAEEVSHLHRERASKRIAAFVKSRLDKANWYRLMHLILNLKEPDPTRQGQLPATQAAAKKKLANSRAL